jgi:hypothetical protein
LPRGERTRAARRSQGEQANARAPDWAVRGAEDARREAESERRAGGAPAWAIEGAETARRAQYGPPPPRPAFQPFWERENGWHFR